MPYNASKNKWENTTSKLNKEKTWLFKNSDQLSDKELLKDAYAELRKVTNKHERN